MRRKPIERDNGWVKYLAQGGKILGLDRDVATGNASWSKTQLGGMTGCSLRHDGVKIELHGTGEFWQSDDMEAIFRGTPAVTPPYYITRRIAKKIEPTDRFMVIREPTPHHMIIHVTSQDPHQLPEYNGSDVKDIQMFTSDDLGKWLVLEIDAQKLRRQWRMSEVRI